MRSSRLVLLVLSAALAAAVLAPAQAARPPFVFPGGCCFYEGAVVRTVVTPSAFPKRGIDNFYAIGGGGAGQEAVVAVAPGDVGYHGGHWAFHAVAFVAGVTPYLLTSEAAVLAAYAVGDVTITRVPEDDFLCPIQR